MKNSLTYLVQEICPIHESEENYIDLYTEEYRQSFLAGEPINKAALYCKIGLSTNFLKRMKDLQTPNAKILQLIKVIYGNVESDLHKKFKDFNFNLEHFVPVSDIFEYFNEVGVEPTREQLEEFNCIVNNVKIPEKISDMQVDNILKEIPTHYILKKDIVNFFLENNIRKIEKDELRKYIIKKYSLTSQHLEYIARFDRKSKYFESNFKFALEQLSHNNIEIISIINKTKIFFNGKEDSIDKYILVRV